MDVAHHDRMKVASSHTYAASPDEVFATMTTPDVLVAKYTALGHRDITIVEHSVTAGSVSVRSKRSVPMEVPGFAKRILSPWNTVEQYDTWGPAAADGSRTGTWKVDARGVPVKVGGTLRITPVKGGTLVEIAGEVSCSVPLLGGKLASFVGGDVERTMRGEEEFNDGHLAGLTPPAKKAAAKKPAAKKA